MTFKLTREQFLNKQAQLVDQGVSVSVGQDAGTISARGVTVSYDYTETTETLDVEVTSYGGHARFFVDHAIKGWFKA